jgi:hypothetical protein
LKSFVIGNKGIVHDFSRVHILYIGRLQTVTDGSLYTPTPLDKQKTCQHIGGVPASCAVDEEKPQANALACGFLS